MGNLRPTRRQFGTAAAAALSLSIAGCAGDEGDDTANETNEAEPDDTEADDDGSDDTEANGDDEPTLTVTLENEDGEPVSENVVVNVEIHDSPVTHSRGSAVIEDGQIVFEDLEEGDHTVSVESETDEFDTVEEDVTMGDEDEEVEFELEGATPDGEVDDENGEEAENGDSDDGNGDDENGNGDDD